MTHSTISTPTKKIVAIERMLLRMTGSPTITKILMNTRQIEFDYLSMKEMLNKGKDDEVLKFIHSRFYNTSLSSPNKLLH